MNAVPFICSTYSSSLLAHWVTTWLDFYLRLNGESKSRILIESPAWGQVSQTTYLVLVAFPSSLPLPFCQVTRNAIYLLVLQPHFHILNIFTLLPEGGGLCTWSIFKDGVNQEPGLRTHFCFIQHFQATTHDADVDKLMGGSRRLARPT